MLILFPRKERGCSTASVVNSAISGSEMTCNFPVRKNSRGEDSLRKTRGHPRCVQILHEEDRSDDAVVGAESLEMFLDLRLAVEVGDTGLPVGVAHGRVHDVRDPRGADPIQTDLAESSLGGRALFVRRGHEVRDVNSFRRSLDRGAFPQIPSDDLGTHPPEFICSSAVGLPRQGPHPMAPLEEKARQSAALLPVAPVTNTCLISDARPASPSECVMIEPSTIQLLPDNGGLTLG